MPNEGNTIEEIEIGLLLRGIEARYGYDLQTYQKPLVRQHVKNEAVHQGLETVSSLQEKLLRDGELFQHFLKRFSLTQAYPFQHAGFLKGLRETVFPFLRTYPALKVWCLGGDVAGLYSLAILLEEAELLGRTTLYFTDVSELVLEKAKRGSLPATALNKASAGYRKAGGEGQFSDYVQEDKKGPRFHSRLRKRVECFPFNPATDSSFNEFNLIVCRGLMERVEVPLRDRLAQLFHDSLGLLGIVAAGEKEIPFRGAEGKEYRRLKKGKGLFQRVG